MTNLVLTFYLSSKTQATMVASLLASSTHLSLIIIIKASLPLPYDYCTWQRQFNAFLATFLSGATATGLVPWPLLLLMCLYMLVASHGQAFFDTASVVSGVQNFPQYGGTAVGIMKGFQGLSSAVLIQVYYTICYGKPITFLLILALLSAPVSLFLMWFVKVVSLIIESLAWCSMLVLISFETKVYIRQFWWYVRFGVVYVLVGEAAMLNLILSMSEYYSRFALYTYISGVLCQLV